MKTACRKTKPMTRYYATTDYDGCPYITAGERYEVIHGMTLNFSTTVDDGIGIFAYKECRHLNGNNWKIGIIREDKQND